MLHFRVKYQNEVKAFLVKFDDPWSVVAAKTAQLFDIPPNNVALQRTEQDRTLITIHNQEELRDYLLGPHSARAVAGLPLDFNLKDTREWKYSVISHIAASEMEDADYEHPEDLEDMMPHTGNGKFTDEDYTFVQPPGLDNSDMVHLVVPGTGPGGGVYAVPRRTGVGSTPNVNVLDLKEDRQDDEGTWDDVNTPLDGKVETVHSVEYPNIYIEEPSRVQSPAGSGPPRIPAREKGKGRFVPSVPSPRRSEPNVAADDTDTGSDTVSNKSIVDDDLPDKPTVHVPDAAHALSPIPLISNVVRKMSLENARARTINGSVAETEDDELDEDPVVQQRTYDTLVNQLVSLVQVVSQVLEDDNVARQVRGVWDGYSKKVSKENQRQETPTSPMGSTDKGLQPKELALADGIAAVIKRMADIVVEDNQDVPEVQEQDGDVIWTHRPRTVPHLRIPAAVTPAAVTPAAPATRPLVIDTDLKPSRHVVPTSTLAPLSGLPPTTASPLSPESKRRLEDAKSLYKAEKARYRAERDQRRRDKLTAKGFMLPDSVPGVIEKRERPIEVTPAPPGRKVSLMSAVADHQPPKSSSKAIPKAIKHSSTVKPSAGTSYSPALLPANMPHQPVLPIVIPTRASPAPISEHTDDEVAANGGSEGDGHGTPKATPQRPSRNSIEFDFDAFMEANQAWDPPKAVSGWLQDQPNHFPISARPSIATQGNQHQSLPPPPRVYMQTSVMDSPAPLADLKQLKSASPPPPPPPPRPHTYSNVHAQPTYAQPPLPPPLPQPHSHMQGGSTGTAAVGMSNPNVGIDDDRLADAFRSNPAPRVSIKRNRWGDGLGGRRMDIPMREESLGEVHPNPPPVYSTDGDGDDYLDSGGAVRPEKALLPLNEEFKRRCLAVLHEYNVTQDQYPNLDSLIGQGIQVVAGNRQMVRLAAESSRQARETLLTEEVPNVVSRVLNAIQKGGSSPNYV